MEKNKKKDEGGGEFRILKMEKYLTKLGLITQKYMANFQKISKKKYLEQKKIQVSGHQEFPL